MILPDGRKRCRIRLRIPVIVIVLAATAIPIELRPLGAVGWAFSVSLSDVLANILGYVPVGLVLAEFGPGRALLSAVLMTSLAEASQVVMMHRDPSVIDVMANVLGAAIGIRVSERFRIRSPELVLDRARGVAAILAGALIFAARATSGYPPSSHGAISPGTLEAHWKLDENNGRVAFDSSGHALDGRFRNEPARVAGVLGRAVKFDGSAFIDFGRSSALRLAGSMTISAWINPSAFPVDDSAIVSSHNGLGYQLDTTVDQGPRTIGFKLANECGQLMARYGATPLVVDNWYHLAGVYNANARTLDVYLNGELDNGLLLGSVTQAQRSSRESVYVGRRSNLKGFEFEGAIDDVRIYSRALTRAEITTVMHGAFLESTEAAHDDPVKGDDGGLRPGRPAACAVHSDYEDSSLPAAAAVFGVLVAVGAAGFWPSGNWPFSVAICLSAGLLLLPGMGSTLPASRRWLIALSSLAGSASVAAGRVRDADYDSTRESPAS
jgi:hypothetical protein